MNYKKIYTTLIDRATRRVNEGYVEKHHIVPRCLGGTDANENIVNLYPEEHYLAHQLLVKIHPTHYGVLSAAMLMTKHSKTNKRMNNKLFGWLRKRASLLTKGVPKSEETKTKMRKPKSVEHRLNISKAQKANGGNGPAKHKEESKIKNGNTHRLLKRDKVTCPHCNKQGGAIAMPRWHFDNCKEKNVTSTI